MPAVSPTASRRITRPSPGLAILLLGVAALGACSPTFNWRELRPAGTPLQALMPCKPDMAERTVPLDGTPTPMQMHSCDAGSLTFAVAWAELVSEDRVPAAIQGWRAGALATLSVGGPQAEGVVTDWVVKVPGAEHPQGVQAMGQSPQGKPMRMRAAYFSKGRQVFQAAVYGAQLPEEELATFFDALKLP
jgi:hypothetical protein